MRRARTVPLVVLVGLAGGVLATTIGNYTSGWTEFLIFAGAGLYILASYTVPAAWRRRAERNARRS